MTVIILTACPAGLRGHLTQWLFEVSAGVYVGHVSARVRQRLWARVIEMAGLGRALMVFHVRGEQRLSFVVHDHRWTPVDVDGITLMRRPAATVATNPAMPSGWSKAGRRRRFGSKGRSAVSSDTNNSDVKLQS